MKTIQKSISFDKEEVKMISEAAKKVGLSYSSFLRTCALDKARQLEFKEE